MFDQQLVDDNGVFVFVDDNGVDFFVDDFENYLGILDVSGQTGGIFGVSNTSGMMIYRI